MFRADGILHRTVNWEHSYFSRTSLKSAGAPEAENSKLPHHLAPQGAGRMASRLP